ncbi:MAG: sensor domain-containing diguanylate cyclase [Hydrogenophaga sp.]|uniref:sensor domain-containing diguanylate cyclase n=1 Tax=Hydrogenophaga sp. TaxID=1904254 RepID=UPI002749B096|nr:sensor domain-containing diguanylate cyclase [Hydrogenophaga sp.]MDP2418408.1 sensor domain-containing diguanylate cyclase [Hydrogenophaga sp.]MDZ4187931.1 sensor domain-containing diguanylate cyclase [Hydrogenophaga sp.]
MHIPTIFAVMTLVSAVMALSLTIAAWKKYPDLQAWAAALGLQGVGYSFFVLRASMPEGWSIVLGNGAVSASMALYAYGLYRFANRAPNRLALYVPMALVLAVNLVWLHDLHTRFLLHSVLYAGQACLLVVLLHRCRTLGTRRGALILGVGVALFILVMLSRFVAVSTGWINLAAYNESNAVQAVTFLISLTSTLMLSVGILLMMQQRAEDRLAVSEHHYRLLVDAATECICIVQGGIIRFANPRMHQLLGYAPGALPGTAIQSLVLADDWPMVQHNHQQRLTGQGDDLKYPTRMNTLHAGVRWFEISGVRIEWQGQVATLNFLNDITQRHHMEETIKGLAYHDTLTHLPNRRLLLDRLGQAQISTLRNNTWAGLVFLDLDRFKILNDTHGHRAGDLLLVEVARRLVGCVRGIDTVARLGGDEFVVLLCDLGNTSEQAREAAHHVAQKMLSALAQSYRLTQEEAPHAVVEHQCSASAGLVLFTGHTTAAEALLEQADAAMYAAKKAGRNQVCMHTPNTPEPPAAH